MRILISSHRYAPDVGGIETVSALLAEQWRRAGHTVKLVTASPAGPESEGAVSDIVRRPTRTALFRLLRECDVCWHNNISLKTAWPLAFVTRPWLVTTQTWLRNGDGTTGWSEWLKRRALRRARNIYISRAIAEHVGLPGDVIPNPYDDSIFRRIPGIARVRELAFVGRLVTDKGVDLLLHALRALAPTVRPRLTIIGGGPEEPALRAMATVFGLDPQVKFAGWLSGSKLAEALNAHRVLVVPSRWDEPFGIVALEGIACGCQVIASHNGGLGDAVGPGGVTFPNGDVGRLAEEIRRALNGDAVSDSSRESAVAEHLQRHEASRVAGRYLEVFEAERSGKA